MTPLKVTAVFDIGKTNKKFFLFDSNFKEVYRVYTKFAKILDEDGDPVEDLLALKNWIKDVFDTILRSKNFEIQAINFSTYGASLVHIDLEGNPVTPLYDYSKVLPEEVIDSFYSKYGPELDLAVTTGSPKAGMLNSGIQLFWLKNFKPKIFKKIKYSLHLPQYISYLFTGIPISEFTSIGCHTSLWNYKEKDYHSWVYKENLDEILPNIVSTETSININYNGKRLKIGVGIHDSSAALVPYIRSLSKKFILVSTGTWSVSLNPFCLSGLTASDIKKNCLSYMRINGNQVKATRLFLGNEYNIQVSRIAKHFGLELTFHKKIAFDKAIFLKLQNSFQHYFKWESINSLDMPSKTNLIFENAKTAYHQLLMELVELQVSYIKLAIGNQKIRRIYVDGGFSDNDIFIKLLTIFLKNFKIRSTTSSLGSALGAAIAISDNQLDSEFLKKNYALTKHLPVIFK